MGRSRRGSATCSSSAAASGSAATTTPEDALQELMEWLAKEGFPEQAVKLSLCGEEGIGAIAKDPIQAGDVALKVPENYAVTSADVANHPVVAQPAAGLSVCVSMDFLL
jgi:histone-lysine N-methyltransferase SETD3